MARLAAREDAGSEDEFAILVKETKTRRPLQPGAEKKPIRRLKATSSPRKALAAAGPSGTPGSVTRRRRIGVLKDNNPLMRKWNSKEGQVIEIDDLSDEAPAKTPSRSKATRKQVLKALKERGQPKVENDDDSEKFEGSDQEPIPVAHTPTRAQPRRAAAAAAAAAAKKIIVIESSEGEEYQEEAEDDQDVNVDVPSVGQTSDRNRDGEDGAETSKQDTSLSSPPEYDISASKCPESNPDLRNSSSRTGQQAFSDEEDLDRQLQEQIEEEMSWVADRQQEAAELPAEDPLSELSDLSDDFEDANETLEEEDNPVFSDAEQEAPKRKPSDSSKAPAFKPVQESQGLVDSYMEEDDPMDDDDGEDDELGDSESESEDEEEEDEDSDFVGGASASEAEEEEIKPAPRSSRARRMQKTGSVGRLALQSRSVNITSPPTHKIGAKDVIPTVAQGQNLQDAFERLQILDNAPDLKPRSRPAPEAERTPPSTPFKSKPRVGLLSPKKLDPIPKTPHHPKNDLFWSQDFVDDWNDTHSPQKLFDPEKNPNSKKVSDAAAVSSRPPQEKMALSESKVEKQARKAFDEKKEDIARSFLRLLDDEVTGGELRKLAANTGGIKIVWTKGLNTTAGRANWKRETIRPASSSSSSSGAAAEILVKHHASIELASKVITEESRLLNVLAHEFCHLTNFMITGETANPHGKSFKAWAAKVTRRFGESHEIEVTTKHSYKIEFRFAWACEDCGLEYKRHSRSIDTARSRCGGCKKGVLRQIKPVPRGADKGAAAVAKKGEGEKTETGVAVGGAAKKPPTEYQMFMKEHMKILRQENPGSPQKDIMKLVAQKWSTSGKGKGKKVVPGAGPAKPAVEQLGSAMIDLTMDG